jgi:fucose permease
MGLSIAPLFPGLMAETPRRLGLGLAAHAVGFQVSGAILGVAVIPALAGLAADAFGLQAVTVVLLGVGVVFLALNEALIRLLDRHR